MASFRTACHVALALGLSAATPALARAETVEIATGEYAPFVSESLENGGPINHIAAVVFEDAGYDVAFTYMPWARVIELTRRGRYHVASFYSYSEERKQDFIHAGPLFTDPLVFYHLASTEMREWSDLRELEGLTIGVVEGYTYTSELWALGEAGVLTLEKAPSDEANFRKMLAGRIDLVPITMTTGDYLLETRFSPEEQALISKDEQVIDLTIVYLLISREVENAEVLARDFNAALERLALSGDLPSHLGSAGDDRPGDAE